MARTRTIEVPVVTELYLVITVPDDDRPAARRAIVSALQYLASVVDDPTWYGVVAEATGGVLIDADLIPPGGVPTWSDDDDGPPN